MRLKWVLSISSVCVLILLFQNCGSGFQLTMHSQDLSSNTDGTNTETQENKNPVIVDPTTPDPTPDPTPAPTDLGNRTGTQWSPFVEWSLVNTSWPGNPYDLIATATFSHAASSETRTTEMFYDGANTWKFRFAGTRTGDWTFVTASADSQLNGYSGSVTIKSNPNPKVRGFIVPSGSKFARMVTSPSDLEGYITNVYMNIANFGTHNECGWNAIQDTFANTGMISAYLDEVEQHGSNGAFALIANQWFSINRDGHDTHNSTNPDPATFQALEAAILAAHARGMFIHLWAWGDTERKWTPEGGVNGVPDRRIQRHIAARLGPLPGWTMGYGFDLHEWVTVSQVDAWEEFLHNRMGWDHILTARKESRKESSFNPTSVLRVRADNHNITSNFYDQALLDYDTGKPLFLSRRFSYLREGVWSMDSTIRALWQFTMVGGAGAIWGHYPPGCSVYTGKSYPNPEWMSAHRTFWAERFRLDFKRDNALITNGVALSSPAKKHYVFYGEATSSMQIDLSGMSGPQRLIAVDTKKAYLEIDLGTLTASSQTITLPRNSNWAIAVGDFPSAL